MLNSLIQKFTKTPMAKTIAYENVYVAQNYHPLPVVLTKGEGVYLWDQVGNKYLDMMSAYSAVSTGHGHPRLIKALKDQADKLSICSRAFHTDKLGRLAEKLCLISGLDMMLPMNTGAEAVETAIKAARLWGYQTKKIGKGHADIIVAKGNFHGRTTTIVGFSSEEKYKEGFGPFTPGFTAVDFGDLEAIQGAITENTCAIMIEPIQGEAGIITPPEGYLKALRKICDQKRVLLILDEVQSGLGRTGKMFAFQHENITPDLLILGKALGGGLLPVSAVVGTKAVMSLFTPGSHGSTFGGNPLSSAVAYEALCVLEEEGLVKNSEILGQYMIDQLRKINSDLIVSVRGKGLWIGVDLDPQKISARHVCEAMMKRGILSKETHETVIRFAPPLTIMRAEIDHCLEVFRETLLDLQK